MPSINSLYDMDDYLVKILTDDYVFKCDNYSVAYQLLYFLDKFDMCEHSQVMDEYIWPYSWIIFITCKPRDVLRIKCVANRIKSSIPANIKILKTDEDTGEEIEVC